MGDEVTSTSRLLDFSTSRLTDSPTHRLTDFVTNYPFPKTERQAELIALADSLAAPFAARAESVDRDGTGAGYDLALVREVAGAVSVPVVACGGVGRYEHVPEAIIEGGASARS